MKKLITAVLILCGVVGSAAAAGGNAPPVTLPKKGDPVAGESKVAVCMACHGPGGASATPTFPKLAGQHESYLYKQMVDVQNGDRVVASMVGILDGLTDQDLLDIAAYYADQPVSYGRVVNPNPAPANAGELSEEELAAIEQAELNKVIELGEKLYYGGNPDTGVPACAACHSPSGSGNKLAGYPQLGGQHATYTAKQLYAFQAGYLYEGDKPSSENERINDGDSMIMRSIAFALKEHEIEALANYIQGLRPRQ
ncbi:c-type cytochrome [Salinibius halmophilus]|uniref:c-type cytochrome n=1 Tax=Salinibius halmophilus TaxID=1853216 RepID=UPI000E663B1E|nr:c-type cytochrome [Salinibius halmophilus]